MHPIYQTPANSSQTRSDQPLIMGILNITPDSFSDGNQYNTVEQSFERALTMQKGGVDIIDIGGESTRPRAAEVGVDEEIERVIPVIEQIKTLGLPISIDTSKAEVMQAAVNAGAAIINDVRALREKNALQTAAKLKVPVCLMHMQGQPRVMQNDPKYGDVIKEVSSFLHQRVKACENAGIDRSLICLDPGFGFGKNLQHNLELLTRLEQIVNLGFPVLAGLSRKSMLGLITDKPVEQRLAASLAVAQIAMQKGARIIRVHDVAETHDIRQVFMAMKTIR